MDSSRFAELSVIFPLCSGGRDVPKDQSKVNVDCVCFNLSILRKKQLTQQSHLFLMFYCFIFPSPFHVIHNESLTHFTQCCKKDEVLSADTPCMRLCLQEHWHHMGFLFSLCMCVFILIVFQITEVGLKT